MCFGINQNKSFYVKLLLFILLNMTNLIHEADPNLPIKEDKLHATEILLQENEQIGVSYFVNYRGRDFIVLPGVFSPAVFKNTYFFADHIETVLGESFLEIGSGTGLIAVMAALNGATKVIATDINPCAVANTQANAELHKVAEKLTVLKSDIFTEIPQGQKFDTIFWNVPFMHHTKTNLSYLEQALFDPYYTCLNRYLKEADQWLNPGGRVLIGFSSTNGHEEVFESLIKKYGWNLKLLAERHTPVTTCDEDRNASILSEQLWEATK